MTRPAVVIAVSPEIGGSGTQPFRVVLLKWGEDNYSVHSAFNGVKEFANGTYVRDFAAAFTEWHKRVGEMYREYSASFLHTGLPV